MQSSWPQAIAWILKHEGSELNLSKTEGGGASRYGVTVDSLTDFYRTQKKPPATIQDIIDLTEPMAEEFFAWFLKDINFDALPPGLDYRLADITVNLGRAGGKEAWELICVRPSGTVLNVRDIICALGAYWIGFKHAQASPEHWKEFQAGWIARYHEAENQALGMLQSARVDRAAAGAMKPAITLGKDEYSTVKDTK